ncbi:MAG: hypothetical protein AB1Z98_13735, partial [Nannocystaceae bacterium]
DLVSIQKQLYALEDKHRTQAVYEAMGFIRHSLEDATFYLLDQMDLPELDDASTAQVRDLLANVHEALPAGSRGRTAQRLARFEKLGLPADLAARIVKLRYLTPVLDAVRLASSLGRDPTKMLWLRLSVTDAINFNDLNQAIDRMAFDSPWDGPSVAALRRQLNFHVHKLVRMVGGDDVQRMVDEVGLRGFSKRVSEMGETNPTISGLVMLDDWLRRLLPPLAEMPRPKA